MQTIATARYNTRTHPPTLFEKENWTRNQVANRCIRTICHDVIHAYHVLVYRVMYTQTHAYTRVSHHDARDTLTHTRVLKYFVSLLTGQGKNLDQESDRESLR